METALELDIDISTLKEMPMLTNLEEHDCMLRLEANIVERIEWMNENINVNSMLREIKN